MRLIRGLHNASLREVCAREPELMSWFADGKAISSVVTIGNFDGVHLGHQAIIKRVKTEAEKRGIPSVVVVFEPQPMEYFKGRQAPPRLMRFRDKFEHIQTQGIDFLFCLKFDQALSKLSPELFVKEVLVDHLSMSHLVVGDDFRFGDDRRGDFDSLCKLGLKFGYTVENTRTICVPELDSDLERSSSTLVRNLLSQAEFESVEQVLGRPYQISGRVVHGQKLGRQIGFPTANIALHRKSVPLNGVYAVVLELSDETGASRLINGVANIGVKPTVGDFKPNLEVHLFDFDADIYSRHVRVLFKAKLRDEMRFNGIEELKVQIDKDVKQARAIFAQAR